MLANRDHMALADAAYLLYLDVSEYSRTTGKPSPTSFLVFWRTRKALASLRYENQKNSPYGLFLPTKLAYNRRQ